MGGNITWIPALYASAFPDPVFRAWVEGNADADWNGILTDAELDAVTQMNLSGMGISSLEGIQYFPQLQVLDCSNNALTELNLSGNPALTSVFCNDNALTSLHVSSCPDLERLACYHNALQTLELRFCPKLTEAAQGPARTGNFGSDVLFYGGSGTNYVLAVDRSLSFQNPDDSLPITEAFFPDPAFRSYVAENLDPNGDGFLSPDELVKVTSISCRGPGVDTPGEIRSLKGIEYFPKLSQLDCGYNQITELDLSHNRELENLFCYHNKLERLNVSGNALLQVLYCNSNAELTSLDVSPCPTLAEAAGTERLSLENYGSGVVGYGAYKPYSYSDYITYRLMTDGSTKLEAGVLPGDLNGNGTVEGDDLIQMRSFLIGTLSSVNRIAADVNGDGKVNIMDLIRLRKFLAGADVSLG